MSQYNIDIVKGAQVAFVGEGPHWNALKNEILYVDVFRNTLHRFVPSTGENAKVTVDIGKVSFGIPVENEPNKYLIAVERTVQIMEWDGVSSKPTNMKHLYTVDEHCATNRINDGKCDAIGRLWAGTMGCELDPGKWDENKGAMYSFGLDSEVTKHFDGVDMSNGLTWSSDNSLFYYIDSLKHKLDAFDFDIWTGKPTNRRTVFDFKANNIDGLPDGMTVDTTGNLWVAVYAGKKVLHIDPTVGKKIGQIDFPATNITSVTFGGPNLDILYATSAQIGLSEDQLKDEPAAGALFQVTNLGARGLTGGNSYQGPC